MLSGGSTVSTSATWPLTTVTVQTAADGRLALGSSVTAEPGEPETANALGVAVGHSSVNELPVAVTYSLKLTTMLPPCATSTAPFAGLVLETEGASSCVVNEKLAFAAGWSGGSPESESLMFAATAVTVQLEVPGRSLSGSSVIALVPEPLTPNVWGLPPQEIVNELVMTSAALSAGVVVVTAGAASVVNENG